LHDNVEDAEDPRTTLEGVRPQVRPEPGAIALVRVIVPE